MNNTINVSIDCVPAALREFFAEHSTIALAFSGGTDSSYLLYAAKACGANVHAYYVSTPFQPQFELDDAKLLAESLHADMTILPFDVLTDKVVRKETAMHVGRLYHSYLHCATCLVAGVSGCRDSKRHERCCHNVCNA